MKRKLDENNEPAAKESQPATKENDDKKASFSDFGLDPRLVQAIAQEQYREPTLVQAKAIPLALEGKDVLAKAKTGSGKTAAYLLPVLQAVLKRKQVSQSSFPVHK
jgi:ATP-dependent RNA helicase DDX56/DBP9